MKNKKVVTAIALVFVMAMNVSAFAHEAIVKNGETSAVVADDRLTDEEVKKIAHERSLVKEKVDWSKKVTLEDVAHLIWSGDKMPNPKNGYVAPIAATASKDMVDAVSYTHLDVYKRQI